VLTASGETQYMTAQISAVNNDSSVGDSYYLSLDAAGNQPTSTRKFAKGESFYYYAIAGEGRKITSVQINENGSVTNYTAESLEGMSLLNENHTELAYPWTVATYELNTTVSFTVCFTSDSSGGGSGTGTKDIKFKPYNGEYKIVRNGSETMYAQNGVDATYTFNIGDEIELTYTPISGKSFKSFTNYDFSKTLSSANPYTFDVSEDTPSGIRNYCA
jgi:hypothetical protein